MCRNFFPGISGGGGGSWPPWPPPPLDPPLGGGGQYNNQRPSLSLSASNVHPRQIFTAALHDICMSEITAQNSNNFCFTPHNVSRELVDFKRSSRTNTRTHARTHKQYTEYPTKLRNIIDTDDDIDSIFHINGWPSKLRGLLWQRDAYTRQQVTNVCNM